MGVEVPSATFASMVPLLGVLVLAIALLSLSVWWVRGPRHRPGTTGAVVIIVAALLLNAQALSLNAARISRQTDAAVSSVNDRYGVALDSLPERGQSLTFDHDGKVLTVQHTTDHRVVVLDGTTEYRP